MNSQRLLELARLLRTIPASRFSLHDWYAPADEGEAFSGGNGATFFRSADCGTSGCACGWAASHEPFVKEGFTLMWDPDEPEPVFFYNGSSSWEAVIQFFEIKRPTAFLLFLDGNYNTSTDPLIVADRIEQFVKIADEDGELLALMHFASLSPIYGMNDKIMDDIQSHYEN